jgi:CubicO group peptidase (beta-lactamase class C family)
VSARLDRTERASFDFCAARYISYQLARGIALVILALVICLTVAPAGATATPAMRAEPPRGMPTLHPEFVEVNGGAPSAGLTDSHELEAFLDDELAQQLAERHIPGLSLAVVKDGQLFLTKGYGGSGIRRTAAC